MGFYHFVLVAVAAFLTIAGAAAAQTQVPGAREVYTPTKRLLRSYTADDEERGISAKLPSLEKVADAFKSSKTKELQGLLKTDESIADALKTLKLKDMSVTGKYDFIETELVAKFFSSPNFKLWSKHAAQINKQDPKGAMIDALRDSFGDKKLATMILLGKDSWRSKSVAKSMESALFNAWYKEGKRPDGLLEDVLNVKLRNIQKHPREMYIWGDYTKYVRHRVLNYAYAK